MQTCSGRSPIPRIVPSGQERRRQRSRALSRASNRIDRRFSHLAESSTEPVGRECNSTRESRGNGGGEKEESIPARADSVAAETVSREARPRRSRFTVNPRRSLRPARDQDRIPG
jgi:hypothetical protein